MCQPAESAIVVRLPRRPASALLADVCDGTHRGNFCCSVLILAVSTGADGHDIVGIMNNIGGVGRFPRGRVVIIADGSTGVGE